MAKRASRSHARRTFDQLCMLYAPAEWQLDPAEFASWFPNTYGRCNATMHDHDTIDEAAQAGYHKGITR